MELSYLDGCAVGAKNLDGEIIYIPCTMASTSSTMLCHMSLRCSRDHQHATIEGKHTPATAYYPEEMAKRVCRAILEVKSWPERLNALMVESLVTPENIIRNERPESPPQNTCCSVGEIEKTDDDHVCCANTLTQEQQDNLEKHIRKIHSTSGHVQFPVIAKNLRTLGARDEVLNLCRGLRCSACDESKITMEPRNPSSFREIPKRWEVVSVDIAEWSHPKSKRSFKIIVYIDEGMRLGWAKMCFEKTMPRNITSDEIITRISEDCFSHYGRMKKLRYDPEGALMSTKVLDHMTALGVFCDPIPGEAHWQLSLAERLIQVLKNTMRNVALEFPDATFPDLLSRAPLAYYDYDRSRGSTPLQMALGKHLIWMATSLTLRVRTWPRFRRKFRNPSSSVDVK